MKSVLLVYDTVDDMINSDMVSSGTTIMCLGYNLPDDTKGGIYRIYSIDESETIKKDTDITFITDNKLFARKVDFK